MEGGAKGTRQVKITKMTKRQIIFYLKLYVINNYWFHVKNYFKLIFDGGTTRRHERRQSEKERDTHR